MNYDAKWLTKLQAFIYKTLSPIITDDKERAKYVGQAQMLIWARAFTHSSVNPKINNEELEFYGDAVLKAIFAEYITQRLPGLPESMYSELDAYYMGGVGQSLLGKQLNLVPYILLSSVLAINFNIEKDQFEAFFGALSRVSDTILKGLGYLNCLNMLIYLFKDVKIDMEKAEGDATTQVNQIFERFSTGRPKALVVSERPYTINIVLTEDQLAILGDYKVYLADPRIGTATSQAKKTAKKAAYQMAFETLKAYGITTEWAKKAKLYLDFHDQDMKPYIDAFEAKLEKEGYMTPYFHIPRKATDGKSMLIQLIGVRKKDEFHQPLATVIRESSANEERQAGRLETVKKYLGL